MDDRWRVLRHISGNFELFGFLSHEYAMVQAVKELLENSLDACRYVDVHNSIDHNIRVNIFRENSMDFVNVEVSDDGCGMKDPKSFLNCFESATFQEKEKEKPFTGKFGVGLSACLLYSQIHTKQMMRFATPAWHFRK